MYPWIYVIVLFGAALAVFFLLMHQLEKKKLKKYLSESWGNLHHTRHKKDSVESLQFSLIAQKSRQDFDSFVDDETWENLNLQEVYWQLNNTQTSLGAERLYSRMRLLQFSQDNDFESLKTYFSGHEAEREKLRFILAGLGKKNNNQAFQIVSDSGSENVKYDKLYVFFGILPLLSLLLTLVNGMLGLALFIASVLFNIIFYLFRKYTLELELERMSYLVQMIHVSKKMSEIDFPYKDKLAQDFKYFKFLNVLGYAFNYKNDFSDTSVLFEYLNAIFMIPFIASSQLKKKLNKHNSSIKEMLKIIADIDVAVAALSFLEFCDNGYCIPEFSETKGVKASEIYHPLLEKPVSNSIDFTDNILISGDNASGKSTFMKTIAVNLLLAQSLNFALAKEFSLSYGGIATSMNIGDNVLVKESHFVAEGRRIKELLDKISDSEFHYLFLDEIFSGTNSAERVSIGVSLMEWLSRENCLYMITTHDIELIKTGKKFSSNYYFTSDFNGDGKNDYKIRSGISNKTNAIVTLEKLDYPKEIVENSRKKLKDFV
ncbi:hypothetical protein OfM1_09550 [Lactovum odontotermitis]